MNIEMTQLSQLDEFIDDFSLDPQHIHCSSTEHYNYIVDVDRLCLYPLGCVGPCKRVYPNSFNPHSYTVMEEGTVIMPTSVCHSVYPEYYQSDKPPIIFIKCKYNMEWSKFFLSIISNSTLSLDATFREYPLFELIQPEQVKDRSQIKADMILLWKIQEVIIVFAIILYLCNQDDLFDQN